MSVTSRHVGVGARPVVHRDWLEAAARAGLLAKALLGLTAVGLLAYAAYCVADARYHARSRV